MDTLPLCSPNAANVAYSFLRHIGFMLDELSTQGLVLWVDERHRWHWRWLTTDLQSKQGFWALGEAMVDAVSTRYPEIFTA